MIECGNNCIANIVDPRKNFSVPKPQDGKTHGQHVLIAHCIAIIFGVLAAIGFDDKHRLPASEVGKIRAKWILAREFVTAKATAFQFQP